MKIAPPPPHRIALPGNLRSGKNPARIQTAGGCLLAQVQRSYPALPELPPAWLASIGARRWVGGCRVPAEEIRWSRWSHRRQPADPLAQLEARPLVRFPKDQPRRVLCHSQSLGSGTQLAASKARTSPGGQPCAAVLRAWQANGLTRLPTSPTLHPHSPSDHNLPDHTKPYLPNPTPGRPYQLKERPDRGVRRTAKPVLNQAADLSRGSRRFPSSGWRRTSSRGTIGFGCQSGNRSAKGLGELLRRGHP